MRPPWRDRQGAVSRTRIIALAATLLPAAFMIHDWATGFFGPLPLIGLVYWSGIWAAAMILATLAVTPLRFLFGWSGLSDARRIVGVSALAYSIVHLIAYFALYRWDWGKIFPETFTRPSLIVATISLVGLAVLGLTSFDAMVNRLGGRTWKDLHSLNYAISTLAVTHFLLSPGIFGLQYVVSGFLFWLLAWRLMRIRGLAERPAMLVALAVGAGLFTFLLQTGWLWAYQHVPPAETLEFTFSLEDEIAPPWQVLAAGLAIALAVAVLRRAAPVPGVRRRFPGTGRSPDLTHLARKP